MAGRQLSADERALWARVIATVRPLDPHKVRPRPVVPVASDPHAKPGPAVAKLRPLVAARPVPPSPTPPPRLGETLDGGWDRRLRQGQVAPDMVVDLHGHTLASAHALLDHSLDRAIGSGVRLMLLVTGKARPTTRDMDGARARGAIRAAVGDWLASSRHVSNIAAVRAAHQRHGGGGALYIVIRRPKQR